MQAKGPQRDHNKGKSHVISSSWQDEECWIKGLVYLVEKAGNAVVLNSSASREKILGWVGFQETFWKAWMENCSLVNDIYMVIDVSNCQCKFSGHVCHVF